MKKLLAIIIAFTMAVSLLSSMAAAYVAPGDDGNISVPYVDEDVININGYFTKEEISALNMALNMTILSSDNLESWYAEKYTDEIAVMMAWNENGLYVLGGAQHPDAIFTDGGIGTRIQIALNPGGLIDSENFGLFFSLVPYADGNDLHIYRHNWESNADGSYDASYEEGYTGKYFADELDGWFFECIIPWSMIASADRDLDLNESDIPLTAFDPAAEGAFCTAMICYIPCDGTNMPLATARTCRDGDANDWTVASYDITLLFGEKTDDTGTGDVEAKDINGDGEIDNKDVVVLFRYVSGSEKEADESKYDVNGDGEVDNKDVVALFRAISK